MWKRIESRPGLMAVLVFVVALLERIALAGVYAVRVYNDTASYRRLSAAAQAGWTGYDGTRVPGYPIFLALFGPDERVYAAQLGLGLLVTMMLYFIGWKLTGRPLFGAAAALAHSFNPGQLFFEASLMTETLATFLVTLAVLGVFLWMRFPAWRKIPLAAGIGLAGAAAGLTRPLYIFLPFWMGIFLYLLPMISPPSKTGPRKNILQGDWRAALAAAGAGAMLLGVWIGFIQRSFHMWNITTLTGYNLIQHTGYYFEYVPDEYAPLRDTYLKYRDARIAQFGTQGNAIWDAIPEMQRVSGLSFFDLSRTLGRISLRLIREHPNRYLYYVARGWWLYWRAPVYWSAENLRLAWLEGPLRGLVLAGRAATFGANLLFLLGSLAALFSGKVRRRLNPPAFVVFLAATIWLTSILQTLPDHGDNPRFLIPMQSLVVFVVLWGSIKIFTTEAQNHREKQPRIMSREV